MASKNYLQILFYLCKIRFPNLPSYSFVVYMYIIYKQECLRKRIFQIRKVPDNLLVTLSKCFSPTVNYDINNCVAISKNYCDKLNLKHYAKVSLGCSTRLVQILPLDIEPDNLLFIGDSLYFNLKSPQTNVTIRQFNLSNIKVATEVELCLVNTLNEISNAVVATVLKNFFIGPKILRCGDLLTINLKLYGPQFFWRLVSVENLYFKCEKIIYKDVEFPNEQFVCVYGESTLKQLSNIQCFLPNVTENVLSYISSDFNCDITKYLINMCPRGLEDFMKQLETAFRPFLRSESIPLKPAFLIQGCKGDGTNEVLSAIASKLGMNLHRIPAGKINTPIYAQTETNIKNIIFKVKLCCPCVVVIDNFENICKNSEDQYDQRIISFFTNQLTSLLTNNPFPILLVCTSNTKDLPNKLKRIFLEIFDFVVPNEKQRMQMISWYLQLKNLSSEIPCESVAAKTQGFVLEDFDALVYQAQKYCFKRNGSVKNSKRLSEEDFQKALDEMQSNYSESLGAPKVPCVQWSDVGGLTDVKTQVMYTINLSLKKMKCSGLSDSRQSGILLYGPPGTGKTLIAKAVATECNMCFLSVKGPELLNMYVGQSEQNVREVFQRARQASPCIIFFDELDSLAPNRGRSGDSGGVMDRIVSQLLAELDGLNESSNLLIMGATNRPDLIDPALLRPGRFDKLLYVSPAKTHDTKVSVLKALTRKFNVPKDIDFDEIVHNFPENISGADVYGICSDAWMSAVRRVVKKIEDGQLEKENVTQANIIVGMRDFKEAIKRVRPSISPEDLQYFERLEAEHNSKR